MTNDFPPPPDLDEPAPLRTCDADGTVHFSQLKIISESGKQYLRACNTETKTSTAMRVGTIVHYLVLGARPTAKPLVTFDGVRRGGLWEAFRSAHQGHEVVSMSEWADAERIAEAVLSDPLATARLAGARYEVPLQWEENGILCSTSGVDIVTAQDALGDLKTTACVSPERWKEQARKMLYPQQLAFYRRGARANGISATGGLFLLGVETKAPYEVVDLELTEGMIDFADRTVSLWLEKLRVYKMTGQFPGYAQSPVPFDVPRWMQSDEDDEDEEDEEEAA